MSICQGSPNHRKTKNEKVRHLLGSASLAIILGCASPVVVSADDASYIVNIPAQPMAKSLKTFAKKAGVQIIYPHDSINGLVAQDLVGSVSLREGLAQLLAGTDLEYEIASDNVVVIKPRKKQVTAVKTSLSSGLTVRTQRPVVPSASQETSDSDDIGSFTEDGDFLFEEIIVTATKRSRRLQDVPLAISALGEQQLDRLGADGFEGY
ncbi:MAG: secretin and TonB N-terminal domain-containing protein, partial [Kordiimonas sp.]